MWMCVYACVRVSCMCTCACATRVNMVCVRPGAHSAAVQDFWERYLRCLELLKTKGQRTVYRLTLVKKWNMTEVAGGRRRCRVAPHCPPLPARCAHTD